MESSGKKVMVVADPTRDSSGALHYALSHTLLEHDELILLHVDNPNNRPKLGNTFNLNTFLKIPSAKNAALPSDQGNGNGVKDFDPINDVLEEMKNECNRVLPKVRVVIKRVTMEGGRDKANTILHHSEVLGVEILVIGQKRSLFPKGKTFGTWPGVRSALSTSAASTKGIDTAEFLIENCKCTCVGVQKKGHEGGYVLNSRIYRNFWVLA